MADTSSRRAPITSFAVEFPAVSERTTKLLRRPRAQREAYASARIPERV